MGTQSAGEQAIAVGHLKDVGLACSVCCEGTGEALGPCRKVLAGVPHHGRLARCPGGGVDAYDLAHRHGTEAERIIVAQVIFGGKGELDDVVDAVDVVRGDAQLLHLLAIERGVMVDTLHGLFEADALDLAKAFAIHALNAFIPNHVFRCTDKWVYSKSITAK